MIGERRLVLWYHVGIKPTSNSGYESSIGKNVTRIRYRPDNGTGSYPPIYKRACINNGHDMISFLLYYVNILPQTDKPFTIIYGRREFVISDFT